MQFDAYSGEFNPDVQSYISSPTGAIMAAVVRPRLISGPCSIDDLRPVHTSNNVAENGGNKLLPKLYSPKTATKLPETATCQKRRHFVAVFGNCSRPKRQQSCRKRRLCCRFRQQFVAVFGNFVASVDRLLGDSIKLC